MKPGRFAAALVLLVLASADGRAADENAALAKKVQGIFKANCYRCHGQDGAVEGGMNFILDFEKLVQRKKVIAGQPDKSPLYKKVVNNLMPPPDELPRPTDADREILKQWIEAGAPRPTALVQRKPISDSDVTRFILSDVEQVDKRNRRFLRYFTIAHLYNAGLGEDELQTYRNALSKLINSLSWHPRITIPKAIDPAKTVLRIDLRDYMWDSNLWNRVLTEYPYGIFQDTAAAKAVAVATSTRLPCVRADWFVATASRAPLYYDLLQTPSNIAELERQLRVDVQVNIQQERVARAGFNGSGISRNNRILERHDSVHGAYWRTYDFNEVPQNLVDRQNLLPDRRNIFAYPIGPGGLENNFQHAGGEVIYNLPNGLHAFALINAVGVRLDKAPTAIVSDPKRPDRAVEAGISCMACHLHGINFKDDQVRDYVDKNPKAFTRADAELIRALYVPKDKMKTLMDRDADQFLKAVAATGAKARSTETIITMVLRYEADLDLDSVASELGLLPAELIEKIGQSVQLSRNLGSLRVDGGTVQRTVFIQAFGDIVRELRLGALFQSTQVGQNLPDNTGEVDPLEGRTAQANSMVFTPDRKYALFASADKTLRLWEIEGAREVKRFVGHTASVWSVAISADGQRALSGSADNTVRLWDLSTGRELRRMEGHTALVSGVAFTPDNDKAISCSYDQGLILWDLKTGKELSRAEAPAKYINCLAVAPDGKTALLGSDVALHLWDITAGKELQRWEGKHTDSIVAVTFSGDGKQALTGSDDRTMRLWDLEGQTPSRVFMGHTGSVKSVAFAADGKLLVSGGGDNTLRVWEPASGKEVAKFAKHVEPVVCVAFSADGTYTFSGSSDSNIRFWNAAKAMGAKPIKDAQPPMSEKK